MRKINEIIVHCAATREGRDFTVEDITRWHKARGFATIGYHYVIYRDGSIHEGRPLEQIGAHCVGHNKHSIGVCYIGGCASDGKTPKDTRTPEQKEALLALLRRGFPMPRYTDIGILLRRRAPLTMRSENTGNWLSPSCLYSRLSSFLRVAPLSG